MMSTPRVKLVSLFVTFIVGRYLTNLSAVP
jgi:hypothetical protein